MAQETELDQLIRMLSKLPGLGPRSASRVALHLLEKRDAIMYPLASAIQNAAENVQTCEICGNWDSQSPCHICQKDERDTGLVCVVEEVSDLWAMERTRIFKGRYHVLGGVISPLDGKSPDDLNIGSLSQRLSAGNITEIILATSATVNGQTTAHYLIDKYEELFQSQFESGKLKITMLSQGVPMGSNLDYLDEGTITAALNARRKV